MTPRQKHESALKGAGFEALAEEHETRVRDSDGNVSTAAIPMAITKMTAETAQALGIDLQNQETLNVTLSLSALGYRPRVRNDFMLDGKKWQVKVAPSVGADVVKIGLVRRTS